MKEGANRDDVAALLEKNTDANQIKQWLQEGIKLDGAAILLTQGIDSHVLTQLINNKADLRDIATNSQILLDGGVRVDLVNGWLKNGTKLPDAIAIINQGVDLNLIGTSSNIGDFTGLIGAAPNEVVSRIPKDAKILPWNPRKIAQGMKFEWTSEIEQGWEVRMHGPDINAPIRSNAASGWVMRIQRGRKYMDANGTFYTENALTNPASSKYDTDNANKTHIPIQAP